MKELKEKQTLLLAALRDINFELRKLQRERQELESFLKDTDNTITFTRAKEIALRNKLSRMISQENALSDRKERTQQGIVQLKQKIEKVNKIRRDLQEV